jgi:hypothetical protein
VAPCMNGTSIVCRRRCMSPVVYVSGCVSGECVAGGVYVQVCLRHVCRRWCVCCTCHKCGSCGARLTRPIIYEYVLTLAQRINCNQHLSNYSLVKSTQRRQASPRQLVFMSLFKNVRDHYSGTMEKSANNLNKNKIHPVGIRVSQGNHDAPLMIIHNDIPQRQHMLPAASLKLRIQ